MTPANDKPASGQHATGQHAAEQQGERILDHDRLQLSALMDGAVAPDEARFLLRRLQHDGELAGCWSRWQLCGDVLRGNASVIVPADFSRRVADAIAAEGSRPARRDPGAGRWLRWGSGAALAASVAVIALFVTRQVPESQVPRQLPTTVVVETPAPDPTKSIPASPSAPDTTSQIAAAMAVADVPRRAIRRSRGQSQRAALRRSARTPEMQVAVAASAAPVVADPFAPGHVVQSRPWPRALLPNSPASGAFTVEYGNVGASSSFYPFAPRAPFAGTTTAPDDAADDGSHKP